MKPTQKLFVAVLSISALISGCGGGSSKKKETLPTQPPVVIDDSKQEAEAQEASASLSGIYSVGLENDYSYLSIEPIQGSRNMKITAYNYIGDAYDTSRGNSGADCYRIANGGDTNAILNTPATLEYVAAKNTNETPKFALRINSTTVFEWKLTRDESSSKLRLLEISNGTVSRSSLSGEIGNAKYSLSNLADPGLNISTIKNKMCVGDNLLDSSTSPNVQYPDSGFEGLYDVTLVDNFLSTPRTFEAYMHISIDGTINTYHYAGDGFNQGDDPSINKGNCYELSKNYNSDLNGVKLKFNERNNYFFAFGGNQSKIFWKLDSNNKIEKVGIASNNLAAVEPDSWGLTASEAFTLSISSKKSTSLTIEAITSQLCK